MSGSGQRRIDANGSPANYFMTAQRNIEEEESQRWIFVDRESNGWEVRNELPDRTARRFTCTRIVYTRTYT